MRARKPLPEFLADCAESADLSGLGKKKVDWWFRAVHPDLRSRNGYRYPWPGRWAEAPGPIQKHTDACPQAEGDGLCVAKTFRGASMGGIPFSTFLLVGVAKRDVLGEDADKIRVRRMYVADVISLATLIYRADLYRANLTGADLYRANLDRADLYRANLTGADLTGANLYRANLYRANLTGANLTGADLSGADLSGANLTGADLYRANLDRANLYRANLTGANLYRANLTGADLSGADLSGADLYRANLTGANADQLTLWPAGFDATVAGVRS